MIVVDTNVLAYLYLSSERTHQSEQALLKDPYWIAPILWRSEFRNILAHCTQRGILKIEDALTIMQEAETFMYGAEYEVTSIQVLSLAISSGCSAYDCEFVALAQDLKISLITVDKKVLRSFPGTAVELESFISNRPK